MYKTRSFARWFFDGMTFTIVAVIITTALRLPIEWAFILSVLGLLLVEIIINRLEARDAPGFEALELMPDIVRVAEGNASLRAQVETKLQGLEQKGIHLTAAITALWAGERNPRTLTAGLSKSDAALMRQVLLLLGEPQPQGN